MSYFVCCCFFWKKICFQFVFKILQMSCILWNVQSSCWYVLVLGWKVQWLRIFVCLFGKKYPFGKEQMYWNMICIENWQFSGLGLMHVPSLYLQQYDGCMISKHLIWELNVASECWSFNIYSSGRFSEFYTSFFWVPCFIFKIIRNAQLIYSILQFHQLSCSLPWFWIQKLDFWVWIIHDYQLCTK